MKFNDNNEDLRPVAINVSDSKYTPFYFIDSTSFNDILIYVVPILFFAIIFIMFSFRQCVIPFEDMSEAIVDQKETEKNFDIDFSIYNLSDFHKFLEIKLYAIQNNNPSSIASNARNLNVSIRYALQKNYEVIDSNTSLAEKTSFIFTDNSNISNPLNLFQHVVDTFDYINIHLYMQGDFRPFHKFIFKYTCTNPSVEMFFDQTLLTGSLLALILLIFFNPKKLNDKKLKYNLLLMNLAAISVGFPNFKENRFILLSIFAALLRYFLLSQIYAIYTSYQSNFVYIIFIIFSIAILYFEYNSFETRYNATFLSKTQQMIILNEERYMMICNLIFATILLLLIVIVWFKEKEIPIQRFRFLVISSLLIIFSSFYYQIFSVYNLAITQTNTIIITHCIIFFAISALSFILFGPVNKTEYRSVDEYDTNLAVDPISDD